MLDHSEKGFDIALSITIRDRQSQRITPFHHDPVDGLRSSAAKGLQWSVLRTSASDGQLTSTSHFVVDLILKRRQLEQDDPKGDINRKSHIPEPSTSLGGHPGQTFRNPGTELGVSEVSANLDLQVHHPTQFSQSRDTELEASKSSPSLKPLHLIPASQSPATQLKTSASLKRFHPAQASSRVSLSGGADTMQYTLTSTALPNAQRNTLTRVLHRLVSRPRSPRPIVASLQSQRYIQFGLTVRSRINPLFSGLNNVSSHLIRSVCIQCVDSGTLTACS